MASSTSDHAGGIATFPLSLSLSSPSEAFSTRVWDSHWRGESKRCERLGADPIQIPKRI